VNNYVEKRGLDTPNAAIRAAFNNLPIGKAIAIGPEIKGLRAAVAQLERVRAKLFYGNFCV
jgi:hypothetical protein